MNYPTPRIEALALHALRQAGLPRHVDAGNGIARERAWSELHEVRAATRKASRATLDGIKDDTPGEQAAEAQAIFDHLMVIHDSVQKEMDERDAAGSRDPRPPFAGLESRSVGTAATIQAPAAAGEFRDASTGETLRSAAHGESCRLIFPELRQHQTYQHLRMPDVLGALATGRFANPLAEAEARSMSIGGGGSSGAYAVTPALAAEFIDAMRAKSVLLRSGVRTIGMTTKTHYLAANRGDPTAQWKAELADFTPSDLTLGRVTLDARKVGALIYASRELIEDSPNVGQAIFDALAGALAVAVDTAGFIGAGGDEPTGMMTSAGNVLDLGAALADFDPFIDALKLAADDNEAPMHLAMSPADAATLAKLKDSQGRYLEPPPDYRALTRWPHSSLPADLDLGGSPTQLYSRMLLWDPRAVIFGLRTELDIITHDAATDGTRNALTQYGRWFRAVIRADWAALRPNGIVKIDHVLQ